jgi:hypothetical protein
MALTIEERKHGRIIVRRHDVWPWQREMAGQVNEVDVCMYLYDKACAAWDYYCHSSTLYESMSFGYCPRWWQIALYSKCRQMKTIWDI